MALYTALYSTIILCSAWLLRELRNNRTLHNTYN